MKRKSWISLTAAFLCTIMLFTACSTSGSPTSPGTSTPTSPSNPSTNKDREIVIALNTVSENFEYFEHYGGLDATSLCNLYDTLLWKNEDGTIVGNLADTWDISEDGLVYTYHIRENAGFSDGTPITTEDVAWTLETLKTSTCWRNYYSVIDHIETLDGNLVQVTLSTPSPNYHAATATFGNNGILPKKQYAEFGGAEGFGTSVETMVSSGPYKLVELNYGVSYVIEPNEYYWGPAPDIKRVKFVKISDDNSKIVALQSGDVDVLYRGITGNAYNNLINKPGITIQGTAGFQFSFVVVNMRDGRFADDIRLRQALAYAINRDDLIMVATEGLATPLRYVGDSSPLKTTGNPNFMPEGFIGYDIERAKELVREAGAEGMEFTIHVQSTEPSPTIATYLQSAWSKIGFVVTISQEERASFMAATEDNTYEISVMNPMPNNFEFSSNIGYAWSKNDVYGGTNWAHYQNDRVDDCLNEAYSLFDVSKREELYMEAIELIWEDVAYIPLYSPDYYIAYSSDLTSTDIGSSTVYRMHWAE